MPPRAWSRYCVPVAAHAAAISSHTIASASEPIALPPYASGTQMP